MGLLTSAVRDQDVLAGVAVRAGGSAAWARGDGVGVRPEFDQQRESAKGRAKRNAAKREQSETQRKAALAALLPVSMQQLYSVVLLHAHGQQA